MYTENSIPAGEAVEPLVFVKYLLEERYVSLYRGAEAGSMLTKNECSEIPHETTLLLVDFNHGEDLEDKKVGDRIPRTVSYAFFLILELRSFLPGNTYLHLTSC